MGLCEELSQLCELLYNAVIQAYADHGMTEELNVEPTRSLV
ncbi:hypothetical protein NC651_011839 [Populus alba x Populus x berolinensis]|nr:hypothetical protein NC651_011839 [Populus alba x Populus x berolinensis]